MEFTEFKLKLCFCNPWDKGGLCICLRVCVLFFGVITLKQLPVLPWSPSHSPHCILLLPGNLINRYKPGLYQRVTQEEEDNEIFRGSFITFPKKYLGYYEDKMLYFSKICSSLLEYVVLRDIAVMPRKFHHCW